jgi:hypothetical protein
MEARLSCTYNERAFVAEYSSTLVELGASLPGEIEQFWPLEISTHRGCKIKNEITAAE